MHLSQQGICYGGSVAWNRVYQRYNTELEPSIGLVQFSDSEQYKLYSTKVVPSKYIGLVPHMRKKAYAGEEARILKEH